MAPAGYNEPFRLPMDPTHPRYKWAVMVLVTLATFMSVLDASIVNVAVPHIMRSFGVPLNDVKWVVSAYMLAYAVLIPLAGWLHFRIGLKRTFVGTLTVFTAASALCGLAWNNESLVFFRILQAIGAGAIMPTSMTLVSEVFAPHERGTAIGIWGLGVVVAPAVGPTLGGLLADTVGWRWIFYINILPGALAIGLGSAWLVANPPRERPFDAPGYALLALFLIAALLMLAEAGRLGWGDPWIVGGGLTALVSLVAFVGVERRSAHPIVDLALFNRPTFTGATLLGVFRSIVLFGSLFLLPVLMQNVMGYSAATAGLVLAPGAVAMGIFMPVAGRLSDRLGARPLAFVGVGLTTAFLYFMAALPVDAGLWAITWPQVLRGLGVALLLAPVSAAAMNAVPQDEVGMASGIINLFQQVGGAAGITVLELLLEMRLHTRAGTRADLEHMQGSAEAAAAFGDVFLLCLAIMALAFLPAAMLGREAKR